MLNSVDHEILNAHKYKIQEIKLLSDSDKPSRLFFLLLNVKMTFNIYEQKTNHS